MHKHVDPFEGASYHAHHTHGYRVGDQNTTTKGLHCPTGQQDTKPVQTGTLQNEYGFASVATLVKNVAVTSGVTYARGMY